MRLKHANILPCRGKYVPYKDTIWHAGASGGAVFNAAGYLVGLVTSNSKHLSTNAIIAKLNYSVSAGVIRPVLSALTNNKPVCSQLHALDEEYAKFADLWKLSHTLLHLGGNKPLEGSARLSSLLNDADILDRLSSRPSKL